VRLQLLVDSMLLGKKRKRASTVAVGCESLSSNMLVINRVITTTHVEQSDHSYTATSDNESHSATTDIGQMVRQHSYDKRLETFFDFFCIKMHF